MTILKADKETLMKEYQINENDTGSSDVQVALLTERISHLTKHLSQHRKDYHTQRGLIKMVGRRKKLLRYLKNENLARYKSLIERLNLKG